MPNPIQNYLDNKTTEIINTVTNNLRAFQNTPKLPKPSNVDDVYRIGQTNQASLIMPLTEPTNSYQDLEILKNDEQFNACYLVLTSQLFKVSPKITGKYNKIINQYTDYLDFIDWHKMENEIFNELFAGYGMGVIYLNTWDYKTPKIEFQPCRTGLRKHVEPMIDWSKNKIVAFNVLRNNSHFKYLSPEDCKLITFSDLQLRSTSILRKVSPYIILKKTIVAAIQNKAQGGFKEATAISPDYQSVAQGGIEGEKLLKRWAESWEQNVSNMQSALRDNANAVVTPMPLIAKTLSQALNQNMVDKLLEYCDKKIYTGCSIAGSLTNDAANNRAKSEQDRDNLGEVTVQYWKNLLQDAGTWVLNYLSDNNFTNNDYHLVYPKDPTAESIAIRAQNINTINSVLPNLYKMGIKVKQESIAKLLVSLDLELEDIQTPATVIANTTENTNNNLDENTRALKKNIKGSTYNNIDKNKKIISVKNKLKKVLSKQYDSFLESISFNRIDVGNYTYPDLSQALSKEELIKMLDIIAQESIKDYQTTYKAIIDEIKNKDDIIDKKIKQTFGDEDFAGTSQTTSKMLNKELKIISESGDGNVFDYFTARKDYFLENGFKRLEDGLFASLYYEFTEDIALSNGDDWVGALDVSDENVRPTHRANDGRAWKVGTTAPGGSSTPWSEFGCRCTYFYSTREKVLDNGFVI